jgi:SAM-dependent methyltransferase
VRARYLDGDLRASFDRWLADAIRRQSPPLSFREIRKGVQALSALYVEGRARGDLARRSVEGRGKRAALATYYAPLHFLAVHHALRSAPEALGPAPRRLIDLGCGTGATGAALARAFDSAPEVVGIDRSGWALSEAQHTWASFRIRGRARRAELGAAAWSPREADLLALGWVVNELAPSERDGLLSRLRRAAQHGMGLFLAEPLARRTSPWWDQWARELEGLAVRALLVRVEIERPKWIEDLDRASGLDHAVVGARVLVRSPGAG